MAHLSGMPPNTDLRRAVSGGSGVYPQMAASPGAHTGYMNMGYAQGGDSGLYGAGPHAAGGGAVGGGGGGMDTRYMSFYDASAGGQGGAAMDGPGGSSSGNQGAQSSLAIYDATPRFGSSSAGVPTAPNTPQTPQQQQQAVGNAQQQQQAALTAAHQLTSMNVLGTPAGAAAVGGSPAFYAGLNSMGQAVNIPAAAMLTPTASPYGFIGVPYGFQGHMPYSPAGYFSPAATIEHYRQGGGLHHPAVPAITPGPPIQTTDQICGSPGSNLFIFHVPNDMTNSDLYTLFSEFGEVISARIMIEKASGRSRGFGFVSYDNPQSADLAIKAMNGYHIGHKRLKVQHKKEKERLDINGNIIPVYNNAPPSSAYGNGNGGLPRRGGLTATTGGSGVTRPPLGGYSRTLQQQQQPTAGIKAEYDTAAVQGQQVDMSGLQDTTAGIDASGATATAGAYGLARQQQQQQLAGSATAGTSAHDQDAADALAETMRKLNIQQASTAAPVTVEELESGHTVTAVPSMGAASASAASDKVDAQQAARGAPSATVTSPAGVQQPGDTGFALQQSTMEGPSTAQQQQQYEYAHTQSVPSDGPTSATAGATTGSASVGGGASRAAGVGVTDGASGSTKAVHLQKAPADGSGWGPGAGMGMTSTVATPTSSVPKTVTAPSTPAAEAH